LIPLEMKHDWAKNTKIGHWMMTSGTGCTGLGGVAGFDIPHDTLQAAMQS
jgi:hypothetical protein